MASALALSGRDVPGPITQRLQYPFKKEFTLNYNRNPNMI